MQGVRPRAKRISCAATRVLAAAALEPHALLAVGRVDLGAEQMRAAVETHPLRRQRALQRPGDVLVGVAHDLAATLDDASPRMPSPASWWLASSPMAPAPRTMTDDGYCSSSSALVAGEVADFLRGRARARRRSCEPVAIEERLRLDLGRRDGEPSFAFQRQDGRSAVFAREARQPADEVELPVLQLLAAVVGELPDRAAACAPGFPGRRRGCSPPAGRTPRARRMDTKRLADSIIVLLGIQPRRMHRPPTSRAALDQRGAQAQAAAVRAAA